jgi:2,3-bisphosphoglycerate-dependent phosphoglycerate mutase
MAYLVLVRHGKSEWNKLGQWTGLTDVPLVHEGVLEAQSAAEAIRDIDIHTVHTSVLTRAKQTFDEIKKKLGLNLEPQAYEALNERDYGIYTGKNKWQVKEEIGEKEFQKLRRGWDTPVPEGESLKDVHARVVPHYEREIHPHLLAGRNILIVAHGNSLRALVKHLEDIADEKISDLEIGTGEVYCYEFDKDGTIIGKEIRAVNADKGQV